jgi:hypothetical protein
MNSNKSKFPIIIAVAVILAAGIFSFILLRGIQDNVNVVVPKEDLAAYSFVGESDVDFVGVPKASVTEYDLTEDEFQNEYEGEVVISAPVLSQQRIDNRYIAADSASFAVVLPDERIVAATSSVAGAAVGTIQAGDVVDINAGGGLSVSEGGSSQYAKVLCIATQPSGCSAVLPPGVNINANDNDETTGVTQAPVIVLLATVAADASAISGQEVTLALNPFCRVDKEGYFTSPREGTGDNRFMCRAPADRLASRPPADQVNQDNQQANDVQQPITEP